MRIAFLGLGRMGRELVVHLIDHGYDVTVWNRTRSAAEPFAQRGAAVAASAADAVRDADVVMTTLFGPGAVRQVVVDSTLPMPGGALWIDMTSIGPADAAWFARWADNRGVRYVHSPVVGSLGPARRAALGVLVGGHLDDVSAATPIVSVWAAPGRLRSYDTAAKAAAAKLVANLTLAVAMQGLVEALRLGHAGGLTTDEVLDALDETTLSAINELKGGVVRGGAFSETQFSASLLHKDARLMLHASEDPLPALSVAFDALTNAVRAGHGEDDFSVVASADRG
jgi:3-hydroxyisobutyrate dehydrogenase